MLTPGVRTAVRVGTPLAIIAIIASLWVSSDDNRAMVSESYAAVKAKLQQRPEFIMTDFNVIGADPQTTADIEGILPVEFPVSSFELDMEELRETVEQLYAIKSARVRVGENGMLDVDVTPRVAVAVWRDRNTLRLIDADGIIAGIIEERAERRDLPLIAGDGAFENIDEALTLFRTAGPIRERVRGLVRMGERRWDLVLDRGQRLLLPDENPITALDRMIVLNEAQDLLDRDVAVVDMRNPKRAVLRMTAEAANAYRRVSDTGD
jgi:cell division protein FtsQ